MYQTSDKTRCGGFRWPQWFCLNSSNSEVQWRHRWSSRFSCRMYTEIVSCAQIICWKTSSSSLVGARFLPNTMGGPRNPVGLNENGLAMNHPTSNLQPFWTGSNLDVSKTTGTRQPHSWHSFPVLGFWVSSKPTHFWVELVRFLWSWRCQGCLTC